jgi:prepilin-type N-terminal cleavage/methylation domain-containing protein
MHRDNGQTHSTQAPAGSNRRMAARLGGFSATELLLVLAICGLLSGYAAPYYLDQVHSSAPAGNCQHSVAGLTEKK